MAVPSITALKMWVGTLFTKDDWDFNFSQISTILPPFLFCNYSIIQYCVQLSEKEKASRLVGGLRDI